MKRLVALSLSVILIISACGNGGYGVTIKKEEQATDYSTVYAEVIEFSGFENKEYESELNMSICNDIESAISEFDEMAQEASAVLPEGIKSDMHITQELKRNSGGIISFVEVHYLYLGGAHGNTMWYPRTINVRSENPHNLELFELFNDDGYLETINRLIAELAAANPDKYNELWAEPVVTKENENQFYLTDNELVIFFPPYVLSYYAKGFIEFPIRLADLSAILKEEYKPAVK